MTDDLRDTVFYYRAHTLMAVRYKDYKAHYVTRSGWNIDPPDVRTCALSSLSCMPLSGEFGIVGGLITPA